MIHGNQGGGTAPDYGDEGRDREVQEGGGGNGFCERTEVLLTVLFLLILVYLIRYKFRLGGRGGFGISYSDIYNEMGRLTPQKKCLIKITNTLRATLGPVYIFLNGMLLPSRSSTLMFAILFSVSWEGISLLVFRSPVNSAA